MLLVGGFAALTVVVGISSTMIGHSIRSGGSSIRWSSKIPLPLRARSAAYWNYQSLQSVYDTLGLGIGLGSSRASSWIIAVISQLGIIGSILMGLLVLELVRGGDFATPEGSIRRARYGARHASDGARDAPHGVDQRGRGQSRTHVLHRVAVVLAARRPPLASRAAPQAVRVRPAHSATCRP